MKNIAIIPARSGSKGLPDKNIRLLCGMPLMEYSIKAAVESGLFDTVMVSTDSEKYANIAINSGAEVPFLRSAVMSSDTASSWDAIREVLTGYKDLGCTFDTFALLQPTSPLRTACDIIEAYHEFDRLGAQSLTSVCTTKYSPANCNILPADHSMEDFYTNGTQHLRRQDLDIYYHENGAIYIGDCKCILDGNDFYRKGCYAYIMSEAHSVDIDTEMDFKYAELLINEHFA